jgi:hypothetical protein
MHRYRLRLDDATRPGARALDRAVADLGLVRLPGSGTHQGTHPPPGRWTSWSPSPAAT